MWMERFWWWYASTERSPVRAAGKKKKCFHPALVFYIAKATAGCFHLKMLQITHSSVKFQTRKSKCSPTKLCEIKTNISVTFSSPIFKWSSTPSKSPLALSIETSIFSQIRFDFKMYSFFADMFQFSWSLLFTPNKLTINIYREASKFQP